VFVALMFDAFGGATADFSSPLTDWMEDPDLIGTYFPSVLGTSFTLFQVVSGGGSQGFGHVVFPIFEAGWSVCGVFIILLLMIVRYAIFNIVVGVLVNTTLSAEKDRQEIVSAKVDKAQAKVLGDLKGFFMACDIDGNGELDKEELEQAFAMPAVKRCFTQLDVPVKDPAELFDLLDQDRSGAIDFDEFIGGILRLKSSAVNKDSANLFANMDGCQSAGDDFADRMEILQFESRKLHGAILRMTRKLNEIASVGDDPIMRLRRTGSAYLAEVHHNPSGGRMSQAMPCGPLIAVHDHEKHVDEF
jgi:hypothetical protein